MKKGGAIFGHLICFAGEARLGNERSGGGPASGGERTQRNKTGEHLEDNMRFRNRMRWAVRMDVLRVLALIGGRGGGRGAKLSLSGAGSP